MRNRREPRASRASQGRKRTMNERILAEARDFVVEVRKMRIGFTRILTDSLTGLDMDINIPQYTALAVLGDKGEITMGTLADGLGITMGAVTNIVDRLVDKELAARDRGVDDRRVVRVKLTAKGKQLLDQAVGAGSVRVARYLAELGEEERKAFMETYRKLASRVMKDFAQNPE